MATRSNIAYKKSDGSVRSIYCHWDGHPAHNGEMLRRHYQEARKIAQLIELGSLSSLGVNVFPVGKDHSFDKPQKDVCVFYGRDRGEAGQEPRDYADIPSWIDDMEEYAYLWNGREWLVNDHGERDSNGFPIFSRVEDVVTDRMLKELGWEPEDVA